ncbi:hypothetical protein VP01_4338g1 [Puccinia sorghi]|uniref:Uncharacterized protein n=1 Tax=Puccinia sorghi TaxID=27349 RepID=A0A0L6UQR6_9BASI|nr:hypothetical protein VP01_4338g1 [Puccinia sorghi]
MTVDWLTLLQLLQSYFELLRNALIFLLQSCASSFFKLIRSIFEMLYWRGSIFEVSLRCYIGRSSIFQGGSLNLGGSLQCPRCHQPFILRDEVPYPGYCHRVVCDTLGSTLCLIRMTQRMTPMQPASTNEIDRNGSSFLTLFREDADSTRECVSPNGGSSPESAPFYIPHNWSADSHGNFFFFLRSIQIPNGSWMKKEMEKQHPKWSSGSWNSNSGELFLQAPQKKEVSTNMKQKDPDTVQNQPPKQHKNNPTPSTIDMKEIDSEYNQPEAAANSSSRHSWVWNHLKEADEFVCVVYQLIVRSEKIFGREWKRENKIEHKELSWPPFLFQQHQLVDSNLSKKKLNFFLNCVYSRLHSKTKPSNTFQSQPLVWPLNQFFQRAAGFYLGSIHSQAQNNQAVTTSEKKAFSTA